MIHFRFNRPVGQSRTYVYLCRMFEKMTLRGFVVICAMVLTSACSKYQKLLKSTDLDQKYEAAIKYYDAQDYYRALPLFEELLTAYRGNLRAEEVYYHYAYCHYAMGEHLAAAHHFMNFTRTFPKSEHAEEAAYMYAYCFYLQSPISSLDQEYSLKAMNELQLFINRYPQSDRVSKCNELIDKIRAKLQQKAFDNAYLYYKIGDYQAAAIAFKNTLKDFPGTPYEEETLFLAVKASYLYAKNSTDRRKLVRYKEALEEYRNFASRYPDSKYMKEAKDFEENILNEISLREPSKAETKL
ncbi:MAG: outer membrane protein assembly factor BamD [Flavobacteriales bacterium]|nr:outer membrane protein assembly factor BamD [Flavobacteriales bacterium]